MVADEFIYIGHDNAIQLQLAVDSAVIAHNQLSRAKVIFTNPSIATVTLDSNTTPAFFDLTQPDRITFKFGQAGLTAGRYSARLVVFDASDANGLVWGDFPVTVQ